MCQIFVFLLIYVGDLEDMTRQRDKVVKDLEDTLAECEDL